MGVDLAYTHSVRSGQAAAPAATILELGPGGVGHRGRDRFLVRGQSAFCTSESLGSRQETENEILLRGRLDRPTPVRFVPE
jgi:hypothetical protein